MKNQNQVKVITFRYQNIEIKYIYNPNEEIIDMKKLRNYIAHRLANKIFYSHRTFPIAMRKLPKEYRELYKELLNDIKKNLVIEIQ